MNSSARVATARPAMREKKQRKIREELNLEGRKSKRQKNAAGWPPGSRGQGNGEAVRQNTRAPQDGRIGSKNLCR